MNTAYGYLCICNITFVIMCREIVMRIDVLKLSDMSDYFKHFVIGLDEKARFYMTYIING